MHQFSIAVTRAELEIYRAKISQNHDVHLIGDYGTAESHGVGLEFTFDGAALEFTIKHKPFFVTDDAIEAAVKKWFQPQPPGDPLMDKFRRYGSAVFFAAFLSFFALALPAQAQSNVSAFQPQYFVGTGLAFDYYGKTGFAAQTEFAANGCFITNSCDKGLSKFYSYTTIELTSTQATMRTGAAYMFFQSGNWVLIGLGDAGMATGSGLTLGSFSGGGYLAYDIGAKLSKGASHFYIAGGGRVISLSGQGVQPIPTFVLGKAF